MWRGSDTRMRHCVTRSSPCCKARCAGAGSSGELVPAFDRPAALVALRVRYPPRSFFSLARPICIARAPGRLDVMGGIADYSGARVLELPLACATFALVQKQDAPRCEVASLRGDRWDFFATELPWVREAQADRWATYVVGVVQALLPTETARSGLRILIHSSVPEGRGVASSAALEVAVAAAVAASSDIRIEPADLAALCQRVENHVVGAPCGIMDQMTSACGKRDRLLQLRCQPGTIEGYLEVPGWQRS